MTDVGDDSQVPVCGAGAAPPDRPVIAVPTSVWRPGDPALLGMLVGVLRGDWVGSGEFCVWVERESGEVVPVMWPSGFSARLDPFELVNPEGAVAARIGDTLTLVGGLLPAIASQPCGLGQDDAFYVMQELP